MFKDQSRLTLSANSRVKLEGRKGSTCIFLLDGSINLNAVAGAKMGVCAPARSLVVQTPFEGQITLDANTFKVVPVQGTLVEGKSVCSESPIFAAISMKIESSSAAMRASPSPRWRPAVESPKCSANASSRRRLSDGSRRRERRSVQSTGLRTPIPNSRRNSKSRNE